MYRSFTNRLLGGVCGGLADRLPINAWLLRVIFVLLTLFTLGGFALVYLALWWILPQQSLISDTMTSPFVSLAAILIPLVIIAAWFGQQGGWLEGPSGQALFLPIALLLLSGVFFLKQLRG